MTSVQDYLKQLHAAEEAAATAPTAESLLETRAREVIGHHSSYWRDIFANVAQSVLITLLVVGCTAAVFWGVGISMPRPAPWTMPDFRFAASPQSALAAFGVLGTLIIALQVGVRSSPSETDSAASAARQIGLETLARLSGAAAVAIGVAAIIGQIELGPTFDPIRYLGPACGALLLATFAGDAASASSARLSTAITAERKTAAIRRLKETRERLESRSNSVRRRIYVLQAVVAFALVPLALPTVLIASWGAEAWPYFWAAVATSLMFVLSIATSIVIGRLSWAKREYLLAAYMIAAIVLSVVLIGVLAYVFQPGMWPDDFRDYFRRSGIALAVVGVALANSVIIARGVPSERIRRRTVGTAVLIRWLSLSESLATRAPRSAEKIAQTRLMLACIAVPPLGLIMAYRRRGSAEVPPSPKSVWVGVSALTAWIAVILVLLLVNPSFP